MPDGRWYNSPKYCLMTGKLPSGTRMGLVGSLNCPTSFRGDLNQGLAPPRRGLVISSVAALRDLLACLGLCAHLIIVRISNEHVPAGLLLEDCFSSYISCFNLGVENFIMGYLHNVLVENSEIGGFANFDTA